jgi:hypothetical protein
MSHGTFSGEPETHWLTEAGEPDRRMKLLARFSFVDPDRKEWTTLWMEPRSLGRYGRSWDRHTLAIIGGLPWYMIKPAMTLPETRRRVVQPIVCFTMLAVQVVVRLGRRSCCISESALERGCRLFLPGANRIVGLE